jgi:hypothetical protein
MPDTEPDQDDTDEGQAAVGEALNLLSRHYDCATIFVSRYDPTESNTHSGWRGFGNWFARFGQIREWLIKREAIARIEEEAETEED